MSIGVWQFVLMIIQLVVIAPIYLLPGIIGQLRKHKSATAICSAL